MIVACLALSTAVTAQEDTALTAPASLHKDPDGVPLVTLPAGAPVEAGRTRGSWNEATVEGWIYTNSTERTRRDGYDLVVTTDEGENLRRSPNGPLLGRVREGTLLERVGQKGNWTRVRRNGWIPKRALRTSALEQPATTQQPTIARPPRAPANPGAPRPGPPLRPLARRSRPVVLTASRPRVRRPSAPRPRAGRSAPFRQARRPGSWPARAIW